MYDAFGWKALGDRKFYYVSYWLQILPAGKKGWEHDWHNGRGYTLVSKEEAQRTYWNFDVLPDPARSSTISSAIADELNITTAPPECGRRSETWIPHDACFPKTGHTLST